MQAPVSSSPCELQVSDEPVALDIAMDVTETVKTLDKKLFALLVASLEASHYGVEAAGARAVRGAPPGRGAAIRRRSCRSRSLSRCVGAKGSAGRCCWSWRAWWFI